MLRLKFDAGPALYIQLNSQFLQSLWLFCLCQVQQVEEAARRNAHMLDVVVHLM